MSSDMYITFGFNVGHISAAAAGAVGQQATIDNVSFHVLYN